ncbi:MAG: hypothetical protein DRR04_10375 [Gammaproteobacteria bacterium]|nr:MAG: hypothetical protein DRR04_10375 [Gammaproteobacteria bacterium]
MALIKQSDLEARLGRSLTTAEASAFTIVNEANQSYVERVIVGSSIEEADPSSRYYDGGLQHLPIDPCTAITELAYTNDAQDNATAISTNDYIPDPMNRTMKTMVRYRAGKLARGIGNVKVSATFSTYDDAQVTAIIKDALLSGVESEITNADNITKESIEGYSVEMATTETKDALNKLKGLFPNII